MRLRLAPVLGLLWPAIGHACSVCYAANDRNRIAFFNTTLLLTVLPLGMIAAGVWWVMKRGRLSLAEEFVDREEWSPPNDAPAGGN
jgi:hypothetical protein